MKGCFSTECSGVRATVLPLRKLLTAVVAASDLVTCTDTGKQKRLFGQGDTGRGDLSWPDMVINVKNWEDTADLQQLCPSYTGKSASHLHTCKYTVDKNYADITTII